MSGRIRSLKPEWLEDEALNECSIAARLLSAALLMLADDYGNGRGNAKFIWTRVFPSEGIDVARDALSELEAIGYITLYRVNEQTYFSIRNWAKHQRVDKPGKPKVPQLSKVLANFPETPENDSESPAPRARPFPLPIPTPDPGGAGGGESGSDAADPPVPTEPPAPPEPSERERVRAVFQHWQQAMKHPNAKLDRKRDARIRQRFREGFSVEELCKAITNATADDWIMGRDPKSPRKYDDLETVLRDAAQVERFRDGRVSISGKAAGMVEHEKNMAEADLALLENAKRGDYGEGAKARARAGTLNVEKLKTWLRDKNLKLMQASEAQQ